MATVVDNLPVVENIQSFGEGAFAAHYFGQTFRAEASVLNSVEFLIDTFEGPDSTDFRLLVTTVNLEGGQLRPGTVLFESGILSDTFDADDTFNLIKVDTGQLKLTAGENHAFILDAASEFDGLVSRARISASHVDATGTDYLSGLAGTWFNLFPATGNRATDFAADWDEATTVDLSFRLTFSEPGVTIIGSNKRDVISETKTAGGQPLPTGNDDTIFGRRGKDKLFGLAGDDALDGGKDKDKLFGGADGDSFFMTTAFKGAPDKIMDFASIDDTIVLARKVFKKLDVGTLSDTMFRDAGENASSADRVIYKFSGALQYDKDGNGGADPVTFAKLASIPDISAADFLIA